MESVREVTSEIAGVSPSDRSAPLKRYRLEAGLTRDALAALSGASARTIFAIEAGEVRPTRGTRRLLALALDQPEFRLFDEPNEAA